MKWGSGKGLGPNLPVILVRTSNTFIHMLMYLCQHGGKKQKQKQGIVLKACISESASCDGPRFSYISAPHTGRHRSMFFLIHIYIYIYMLTLNLAATETKDPCPNRHTNYLHRLMLHHSSHFVPPLPRLCLLRYSTEHMQGLDLADYIIGNFNGEY